MPNPPISPKPFLNMLREALGLEFPVASITVRGEATEVPRVTVEFYPRPEHAAAVAKVLAENKHAYSIAFAEKPNAFKPDGSMEWINSDGYLQTDPPPEK